MLHREEVWLRKLTAFIMSNCVTASVGQSLSALLLTDMVL